MVVRAGTRVPVETAAPVWTVPTASTASTPVSRVPTAVRVAVVGQAVTVAPVELAVLQVV